MHTYFYSTRSLEFELEKPHFAHSFTVILVLITHHALTSVKRSIEEFLANPALCFVVTSSIFHYPILVSRVCDPVAVEHAFLWHYQLKKEMETE